MDAGGDVREPSENDTEKEDRFTAYSACAEPHKSVSLSDAVFYTCALVHTAESVLRGSGSTLRTHVQLAVVALCSTSSPWPYSALRYTDHAGCGDSQCV